MDIRIEVLRVNGSWLVAGSGPERRPFNNRTSAITAAIAAACLHYSGDGGRATVHLWDCGNEEVVFDTSARGET